jgi:apolipoprotein N-acyltransferase
MSSGTVRTQPRAEVDLVARVAFVFTMLGIFMVWATTVALDFPDSFLRLAGWISLALFSVAGATIVAAVRCTEDLKDEPIDEPTH